MWLERIGVPPGEEGHAITYSHTVLLVCPECGSSQVEKLDHDCFDYEEVWDQREWYILDPSDTARLRLLLDTCPQPQSPECDCAVHRALRSACQALPTRAWSWSLEAEAHIHRVRLQVDAGRPTLQLKT